VSLIGCLHFCKVERKYMMKRAVTSAACTISLSTGQSEPGHVATVEPLVQRILTLMRL
jgi:hypothetical protein